MSDDAFLSADLLKPAPGVRNATESLLSSIVSSKIWVNHEQHPQLVRYWNNAYRSIAQPRT